MCAQRDKERVNVNLSKGLKEKAKAEGINLSKTLEKSLKAKLDPENASSFSRLFASEKSKEVGPPGFEPGSLAPKARRLGLPTPRPLTNKQYLPLTQKLFGMVS